MLSVMAWHDHGVWADLDFDRLYVKSPILATGAVIVDLPGVHDANAARAAVAEAYMQSRFRLVSGNVWKNILMLLQNVLGSGLLPR